MQVGGSISWGYEDKSGWRFGLKWHSASCCAGSNFWGNETKSGWMMGFKWHSASWGFDFLSGLVDHFQEFRAIRDESQLKVSIIDGQYF